MHTNFDLYLSHGRSLNEKFLQSAGAILNSDPAYLRDPAFYQDIIESAPSLQSDFMEMIFKPVSPEEFQQQTG